LAARTASADAQASLLAPTGTIGFMMDCDTTGIEPPTSRWSSFKKLVGGGSMQIRQQTVRRALKNLGYTDETGEAVVELHRRARSRRGAARSQGGRLLVFDCAMGERAIRPMATCGMMAAVQPFLSGAISEDGEPAGVGDHRRDRGRVPAGLEARPQGAGRVNRDNCKVVSPCPTQEEGRSRARGCGCRGAGRVQSLAASVCPSRGAARPRRFSVVGPRLHDGIGLRRRPPR